MASVKNDLRVDERFQPLLRQIGLDAETIFTDPRITAWRKLKDRENCTLDDQGVRLHIKRFGQIRWGSTPAQREAHGIMLLSAAGIPTVELVAWGSVRNGRSFIITRDLAGYRAADKLVEAGLDFARIAAAIADLTARLHAAGLHHRDLYLCHFFVNPDRPEQDVRLIDAARVAKIPSWPWRKRWIVKDLAQFWYSLSQLGLPAETQGNWLQRYALRRQGDPQSLRRAVERKAAWIGHHDARLRAKYPLRNISIPNRH